MLELVRFQKKELKQVAGAEEVIYSATDMIKMENANISGVCKGYSAY